MSGLQHSPVGLGQNTLRQRGRGRHEWICDSKHAGCGASPPSCWTLCRWWAHELPGRGKRPPALPCRPYHTLQRRPSVGTNCGHASKQGVTCQQLPFAYIIPVSVCHSKVLAFHPALQAGNHPGTFQLDPPRHEAHLLAGLTALCSRCLFVVQAPCHASAFIVSSLFAVTVL